MEKATTEATTPTLRPRSATMSTLSGKRKLDTTESTFDPNLDIATVVFSHVQCVKTRLNLALVSKLWRDASKPAAAYPLTFDFRTCLLVCGVFMSHACWTTTKHCLCPTRES